MRVDLGADATLIEVCRQAQSTLEDLSPALLEEGKRLLSTLRPGLGSQAQWWDRFSRLTLLYPLLQFEKRDAPPPLLERSSVAHVLLVLHTFFDDRFVDGQEAASPEGVGVAESLLASARLELRRAVSQCRSTRRRREECASMRTRRLRRFREGQSASYRRPPPDWSGPPERWYDRLAQDRAAPGAISTLTVAIVMAAPVERIELAYDELVTGLQWLDDFEDWESDYLESRESSILARACSLGETLPAPSSPEAAIEAAAVLERCGAFDWALSRAEAAFRRAARIQSELGCESIVQFIDRRIERVAHIRSSLLRGRARELLLRLGGGALGGGRGPWAN